MQKLIFRLALLIYIITAALVTAARIGRSNQGNAARGERLFAGNVVVCFACHTSDAQAISLESIGDRVLDVRLQVPENAGKTPEQFLAESILYHDAYIAPNTPADLMPTLYTRLLTRRDTQDLVAYLLTL